jgi:hypothetical protein
MVKKKKNKNIPLNKQIKKIKLSIENLENSVKNSDTIKKYDVLSKKIKKCENKIEYYEQIVNNNSNNSKLPVKLGELLEDIEEFDKKNDEENTIKFNEYIERLTNNKKLLEDNKISFDNMISKYIESKTLINWCNNYINAQKMNWEIIK